MKPVSPTASGVIGVIALLFGVTRLGSSSFGSVVFGNVVGIVFILVGACSVMYCAWALLTGRTTEELEEDEALDKREREIRVEETRIARECEREARGKELSERESKLRKERARSRPKG